MWLRTLGADALIFPSTRVDAFAEFIDGRLVDHGGWNLVDYRNAPIEVDSIRILQEPMSWMRPPSGLVIQQYHPSGSGSFRISGLRRSQLATQRFELERAYQRHYLDSLPEAFEQKYFVRETGPYSLAEVRALLPSGIAQHDETVIWEDKTGNRKSEVATLISRKAFTPDRCSKLGLHHPVSPTGAGKCKSVSGQLTCLVCDTLIDYRAANDPCPTCGHG